MMQAHPLIQAHLPAIRSTGPLGTGSGDASRQEAQPEATSLPDDCHCVLYRASNMSAAEAVLGLKEKTVSECVTCGAESYGGACVRQGRVLGGNREVEVTWRVTVTLGVAGPHPPALGLP